MVDVRRAGGRDGGQRALHARRASTAARALAICTVSDHIVTGEETTSQEREQTFGAMVEIALARRPRDRLRRRATRRPRPPARPGRAGPAARPARRRRDVVEAGPHRSSGHAGELGPGQRGRARAGAGRRSRPAWSSSRRRRNAAVGLGVDRVDPAAHHLAAEHERERRLDRVRARGRRTGPASKAAISSSRSSSSSMPASARPGQVVGVEQRLLAEAAPRPRRGSGCRSGPRGDGGRGIGRASSRAKRLGVVAQPQQRGRRQARAAAAPRSSLARSGRASASSRSRSSSQSATCAASTMSRPSSGAVRVGGRGPARRRRAAARASAPGPVGGPRPRRVHRRRRGCGAPRSRLVAARRSTGSPHSSSSSRTTPLVGRRPERRGPRGLQTVRRHGEAVGGPGEGDVAEPELLGRRRGRGCRRGRRRARPCRGPASCGQVARRRRAAARAAPPARRSTACATGWSGSGVSQTPTRKTDVPLQALGPVDGQQLDRVGLGRRGDVEAVALVVLGREVGQQRRQRDVAVDGLELGDRLDEQVEVVAPRRRGRADAPRPARRRCRWCR